MNDTIFKEQILEDLQLIKQNIAWDLNIQKDEYAFNYWILSNIYNLDEEECNNNITEYNDKGIDCFVHFEEDKELFIIQNKYYSESTNLSSKEVTDFLIRPLSKLKENSYSRSPELQKIYNNVKEDKEYKIFLHFYITNNRKNDDIDSIISSHITNDFIFKIFYLNDIKDKYFGQSFKEKQTLSTKLEVKNKGTYLAIRPQEYSLPNMSEAYYVMAKITDVYSLWKDAEIKQYPLFEENIREYLGGTSGINKGIIDTLRDESQRGNFFYYNNGITIICDKAKADAKAVEILNPQIVNGCQTVNSIAEVLKNNNKINENFKDVYVMVKILVLEKKDTNFYRNIVRYTNSQNSINDKVFGATLQPFFTIQENLKKYGILLNVKQSDRYNFKEYYKNRKEYVELLNQANKNSGFYEFKSLNDLSINLETLIQIIGAYKKDAFFAYTKKSLLLKPSNKDYYQNFSTKIGEYFTSESMSKLILFYKKSEFDKKNSSDKKSPAPYYLLNFIGYYLTQNEISKHDFLKSIKIEDLDFIYNKFKILTNKYYSEFKSKHNLEYNQMIKQKVDIEILNDCLTKHLDSMEEYNNEEYLKLIKIIDSIKDKNEV